MRLGDSRLGIAGSLVVSFFVTKTDWEASEDRGLLHLEVAGTGDKSRRVLFSRPNSAPQGSLMARQWFASMLEIEGVEGIPLLAVEEANLLNREAVAEVRQWNSFSEEPMESLEWRLPSGQELHQSPSSEHLEREEIPGQPAEQVAAHISEALLLPGTPSDYHFAILNACEKLWGRRGYDYRCFGWIEGLCLADITMFESIEGLAARVDGSPEAKYDPDTIPAFPSFNRLSGIYMREGFITEAAALETRMTAIAGRSDDMDSILEKQSSLRSGDAG